MLAITLFYCYAHQDQSLRVELDKHLHIMKRQNLISSWHDQDISAGQHWKDEIFSHLNTANIILLLISPDFIASDYCYSTEMMHALQRHKTGEAHVIPIIVRPVDWQNAPFSNLQVLPTNRTPVSSWSNRDDAFLNVAKAIRKTVQELFLDQIKNENFHEYLKKRYQEALATYEQAVEIAPQNALAHLNKGEALYALQRYDEALKAYDEAIQFDSENATSFHRKGKVLHKLCRYEDALASYEEALRLNPYFAEAYRDKAIVLEVLAAQARQKADEIENHNQPIPPSTLFASPQEKDSSFIRLGTMISNGKIQIGDRVYVEKHPNQVAEIVDGRTVEFQGKRLSINDWAKKITGWSAINIYNHVYLERTKQPLGNLRE